MTAVPSSAEPQCPSPVGTPTAARGDAGRRSRRPARTRGRVWSIIIAGVAGLAFCWLFATAFWRMYGPQFVMLSDGWVRVVDRDFGFETELPGWYSKRPGSWGGTGVYYQSRFASSSWATFDIQVTNWKPTTRSASAELLAILD